MRPTACHAPQVNPHASYARGSAALDAWKVTHAKSVLALHGLAWLATPLPKLVCLLMLLLNVLDSRAVRMCLLLPPAPCLAFVVSVTLCVHMWQPFWLLCCVFAIREAASRHVGSPRLLHVTDPRLGLPQPKKPNTATQSDPAKNPLPSVRERQAAT